MASTATIAAVGSPAEGFGSGGPVAVALDVGWEITDLFCDATVRGETPEQRDDLPTLSDLAPWQKTELGLSHVAAALHRLGPAVSDAGLLLPDVGPVETAFKGGALRSAIYQFHVELLQCLHATDASLGKAYDLGRSLAYTCRSPTNAATLRAEFDRYRLFNLEGWLADLATALPDHASRAVSISLGIWQQSIPEPNSKAKRWQVNDNEQQRALRALHRQAKLWRAVLVGEKSGRDVLKPADYIGAAGRLFVRATRLAWSFVLRTWFVVPIILGGSGFAVWTILTSGGQQAPKIVGAIGAGATALGITWKGTKATLGDLALKLEQPLWQAELDVAIGLAVTTLDHTWSAPSNAWLARKVSPQGPSAMLGEGASPHDGGGAPNA